MVTRQLRSDSSAVAWLALAWAVGLAGCAPQPCGAALEERGHLAAADLENAGVALVARFIEGDETTCSVARDGSARFQGWFTGEFPAGELYDLKRPFGSTATVTLEWSCDLPDFIEESGSVSRPPHIEVQQLYSRLGPYGVPPSGFRAWDVQDECMLEFAPDLMQDGTLAGELIEPVSLGLAWGDGPEEFEVVILGLAFRGVEIVGLE